MMIFVTTGTQMYNDLHPRIQPFGQVGQVLQGLFKSPLSIDISHWSPIIIQSYKWN